MNIRSFIDDQRALGHFDKLMLLAPRWARRAKRWASENCQDFSEALEVAGYGCMMRLRGNIVSAQSCEMTFEETMYRIEKILAGKHYEYLPNKKIVPEKSFC